MTTNPAKISVIGARGQVAQALQREAQKRGGVLQAAGRPDVDLLDMEQVAKFLDDTQPSVVINAAAYTAVDAAQSEGQAEAYTLNAEAPARLAVLCAANNIPLVHLSTEYVFNGLKGEPYLEDDEVAPLNVYGASKAAGEMGVRAGHPQHVILRTQWVYSPDGKNFAKTMLRLAQERDDISVVCDQIGAPTSADDIAMALLDICQTISRDAPADLWGTFHFSNDGFTSWHGFAAEIFKLASEAGLKTPELNAIGTLDYPTPAVRPPQAVLSTEKLQAVYGIKPASWQDALSRAFPAIANAMSMATAEN